jgi:diguanylate cyclase (GGDEF)-like protein/PAS domain S-box-containing protein
LDVFHIDANEFPKPTYALPTGSASARDKIRQKSSFWIQATDRRNDSSRYPICTSGDQAAEGPISASDINVASTSRGRCTMSRLSTAWTVSSSSEKDAKSLFTDRNMTAIDADLKSEYLSLPPIKEGRAHHAVYMIDCEGFITSWNSDAQRLKGYATDEVVGRHFSIFHSLEDRLAGIPHLALEAASTEGRYQTEGWRMDKEGHRFWAQVEIQPVFTGAGDIPLGFIEVIHNLTERNEVADRLRHTEHDLSLALRSMSQDMAHNMIEERQVNQMRAEREGYFHALVENSPDVIVRYDQDCRRIYTNLAHERVTGIEASAVLGKTPVEFGPFEPELATSFQERILRVVATGVADEINIDFTRNNESSHFCIRAVPETDADGKIVSVLTIARDMSDHIKAERQLQQREREYRTLVENSPDFIARYDQNGRCLYMNPVMSRQLGVSAPPLDDERTELPLLTDPRAFAARMRAVFDRGAIQEIEASYRTDSGQVHWGHVRFAPEFDAQHNIVSVLAVSRDITELVESRDKINHLAYYDALTDLPNRALLYDYAQTLTSGSNKDSAAYGFMMLDLDRFKEVNDTLGHAAGDQLLCEVAKRLRSCLRQQDIVARLGGDEFAVLLPDLRHKTRLAAIAVRILRALAEPYDLANREIVISASVGIARYPEDSENFLEILKNSDAAMYKAKTAGRNNYQFYDAEMMARAIQRMMIEATLRKALSRNELELYYQPQVMLPAGRIVGAEALLRWHHPELGLLTPDRFISIAEETELIIEIGRWVIQTACRTAAAWNRGRHESEPILVSANISSRQVTQDDIAMVVAAALAATGCEPEWLCLEITESLILDNGHTAKTGLDSLKHMGVAIAVDDFGTGYSALSYLNNFPIDVLKIDRSFIREIGMDHKKTELTKAIIGIAKVLDLKIVAEGVETETQSEILAESGCLIAQGYLYGRPMQFDLLTQSLRLETGR